MVNYLINLSDGHSLVYNWNPESRVLHTSTSNRGSATIEVLQGHHPAEILQSMYPTAKIIRIESNFILRPADNEEPDWLREGRVP